MKYIKVTELKKILKDVSLSNNDLGRYGDGFGKAMHLVNKRLETINYTRCCEELKDKPKLSFKDWIKNNNIITDPFGFVYKGAFYKINELKKIYKEEIK